MLEKLKKELVQLHLELPKNNLVVWAGGNVSARDAETGLVVIKASGMDERSFLKWGLKRAKILDSWGMGIKVIAEYPMFETLRNRFPLKDKMLAWMSDLFKMQYFVHLCFVN